MAGGIGPENRRDVQPPNYITNVQQYMMNEQLIRQIIDTIEKSVKENGRALSKVEARVLNLGKGIIENYSKVAEELKASGSSNPNKNQAQLIKTSMDDLFKDLRLLIKSNPSGLGKNERADESWREVARLGQDLADNITGNLERITSVMENIIDFQKEAQKITEKSSSNNTSTISDMERIGKAREKGIISDEFARRLGHAVSNAKAPSSEQNIQTYFSTLEDIHRQDNFRKAKLDSERDARRLYHKNHPFGGAVSGTAKKAVGVLSTRSDFFNQLHKTIGMIPGIGKITGGLAGASKAATAGAGIAGAAGAIG